MQLIDNNTITALSTYLGRKNQLSDEFRNFAESVRAQLGPWRETRRHEEGEKQLPNGLQVYARRYQFRKHANTTVGLSFWVDENARSTKGLKLWVEFWTNQKDVIRIFAKHRLLTKGAANSKFNSPFKFWFESTEEYLWIGHSIPQRREGRPQKRIFLVRANLGIDRGLSGTDNRKNSLARSEAERGIEIYSFFLLIPFIFENISSCKVINCSGSMSYND